MGKRATQSAPLTRRKPNSESRGFAEWIEGFGEVEMSPVKTVVPSMTTILLCANRARRIGFVSFSGVIIFLTSSATATSADIGIAARYPGDKNIASDPTVVFADDFESYTSPSQLTSKWTSAYQLSNLRIATEQGNYYAGGKIGQLVSASPFTGELAR